MCESGNQLECALLSVLVQADFGTHISMPQERLHVQCVVVLATNRTFILFKYLRESNVVFQAFSSITFESTETLTDM